MKDGTKELRFNQNPEPFVIHPDPEHVRIQKGMEALARDLSARMHITLAEATILVVMCSRAQHWFKKKGVPEYLLEQMQNTNA